MTFMEKLMSLTPEQRKKFTTIKDVEALDAFAAEHGIELNQKEKTLAQEYFQSGMLPIEDDDLDAVAGGAAKDISPALAAADGRTEGLPPLNFFCICHHENKWAKSRVTNYDGTSGTYYVYFDVKCYKCGKTSERLIYNP